MLRLPGSKSQLVHYHHHFVSVSEIGRTNWKSFTKLSMTRRHPQSHYKFFCNAQICETRKLFLHQGNWIQYTHSQMDIFHLLITCTSAPRVMLVSGLEARNGYARNLIFKHGGIRISVFIMNSKITFTITFPNTVIKLIQFECMFLMSIFSGALGRLTPVLDEMETYSAHFPLLPWNYISKQIKQIYYANQSSLKFLFLLFLLVAQS